ncbi:MAG: nuclear transport factor 2 family protein [Deltaproteobacteria bacterium]|nr:nuclear transport factor 2 family protein [Deltaproteobacteria bacterium]
MKKFNLLIITAIAISLIFIIACNQKDTKSASYGEDRAQIEDLQARYLFALDFFDLDTYVSTFTEDGELDIVEYKVKGRDAIRKAIEESRAVFDHSASTATGRHNITNIVIKVEGDKAYGRSYWFHYSNDNPEKKAVFDGYGHYEDEMVKVNGQWLFSKRVIYNEGVEKWMGPTKNPAW